MNKSCNYLYSDLHTNSTTVGMVKAPYLSHLVVNVHFLVRQQARVEGGCDRAPRSLFAHPEADEY